MLSVHQQQVQLKALLLAQHLTQRVTRQIFQVSPMYQAYRLVHIKCIYVPISHDIMQFMFIFIEYIPNHISHISLSQQTKPVITIHSQPSENPSVSHWPTSQPSENPSISDQPSSVPSESPSVSAKPSSQPSEHPSQSDVPSLQVSTYQMYLCTYIS